MKILITLVFVGVVTGLTWLRIREHTQTANVAFAQIDVKRVRDAIEWYRAIAGGLPGGDVFAELHRTGKWPQPTAPLDPWGNAYRYVAPSDEGAPFLVRSDGPDAMPGTGDDLEAAGDIKPSDGHRLAPSANADSPPLQVPKCAELGPSEARRIRAEPLVALRSHARLVPNFQGGRHEGFKAFSVTPDGSFGRADIKNWEVLVSIDDERLNSGTADELLTRFSNRGRMTLVVRASAGGPYRCLVLTLD